MEVSYVELEGNGLIFISVKSEIIIENTVISHLKALMDGVMMIRSATNVKLNNIVVKYVTVEPINDIL